MKKLYTYVITSLLAFVIVDLQASFLNDTTLEINNTQQEKKCSLEILKKAKKNGSELIHDKAKRAVKFNDNTQVQEFSKYIFNDKENKENSNVSEYFFSLKDKKQAAMNDVRDSGMNINDYLAYHHDKKAGHRLRVKGVKYDALERSHFFYQMTTAIFGSVTVVTSAYILFQWLDQNNKNQCSW